MLHLITKAPYSDVDLKPFLETISDNDSILFLGDGVYTILHVTEFITEIKEGLNGINSYALMEDIKARGIDAKILAQIKLIGYPEFVDLTLNHNPIQTWL